MFNEGHESDHAGGYLSPAAPRTSILSAPPHASQLSSVGAFDPSNRSHADAATQAFGHWFDAPAPAPAATRLTQLREVFDVGEQIVGSSHVFEMPVPYNAGVHVGAAAIEVRAEGEAFHARLDRDHLEESGAMNGTEVGEQAAHPILVRFAPNQTGVFTGSLTFKAAWADGHVEMQTVRLAGRARELSAVPSSPTAQPGPDAAAVEAQAREQAAYNDPVWRAGTIPSGDLTDFDALVDKARRSARHIASDQQSGVAAVEKEIRTYKAPPKYHALWWDLVEVAITLATVALGDIASKRLGQEIGGLLMEIAGGGAVESDMAKRLKDSQLVQGLTAVFKEEMKAAGKRAAGNVHPKDDNDVSSDGTVAFFEAQALALGKLEDENSGVVDSRKMYLQPVLATSPALAKQTMRAVGDSLELAVASAHGVQKAITAAQWSIYQARRSNEDESLPNGGRVTQVHRSNAVGSGPTPIPLTGVLELGVEIEGGLHVRSAFMRGMATTAAENLSTIDLAHAGMPLRIVIAGNSPDPTVITRDEAGRVRTTGNLARLASFNGRDGAPKDEAQAERAAHAIFDNVFSMTLAQRGLSIRTDDRGNGSE